MSMPNKKTIDDIIKHNIGVMKKTPKKVMLCEHELKKHKIIFPKQGTREYKIIYRQCKHCDKYMVCADPEWIKYHGPEGRG